MKVEGTGRRSFVAADEAGAAGRDEDGSGELRYGESGRESSRVHRRDKRRD